MKTRRNDPCPCGSGKKHKKCCLATHATAQTTSQPSPRFRFEDGSYGGPVKQYMPSAICHEQISPGEWREHFCLVNPTIFFDKEDDASICARIDLNAAAAARSSGGTDTDFAMILRDKGYVKLDDFKRAKT